MVVLASRKQLRVTIPAGVDTGSRIRFRGKGDAGLRGAQGGDLIVFIGVREHERFQRRGADLVSEIAVPFTTAALGGKFPVATFYGEETVEIPPATQAGEVIRLRSKGMPVLNSSSHGDLHLVVRIPIPEDMTARQQELLREFAQERGENVEHRHKSVFQKVKEVVEDVVDEYREKTKEAFGG